MAASKKVLDNSLRLRYIRALERFHKSLISYLTNTEDLTSKGYNKKIDSASKLLNRVESMPLYKGDFQDLQKLIEKMISYKDSELDIQEIKNEILYSSNQLDKSKNARRYKKDKHNSSQFDDWE